MVHTHDEIVSETVYLPMASFITSYAKEKLVKAINSNYKTFTRKPSEFADSLTIYAKYKYATDPNYKFKINNMYKQMWG